MRISTSFCPLILCLLSVCCSTLLASQQPNIIFILTDDQGYGDLERHGHPYLKTPHTNRLHDESVRFDNFYVSPSCSPTRTALMTGMHEFQSGVTHTLPPREKPSAEMVFLPELLKEVGYHTGFVGKWHLGGSKGYRPEDRGFDWTSTNPRGPRRHFDPEIIRNGVRTQREGYREDIFFDEAMTFIEESADRPFFCYLATYSPHTPLAAPESFIKPFRDAGLNDTHATYLAMVENVDYNVGRLLDFLERTGRDENTILIFMNDNGVTEGLDVYNANMRGSKCTAWEGGSRAMSFWRWPNQWQPHEVNQLTAHLDVLPTLCELAGASIPGDLNDNLEGYSLVSLLEGAETTPWQDGRMLYHHVARWPSGQAEAHKYAMVSVHKGDFLLVRSESCGTEACEEFQSQCTTMRAVRNGLTRTTYAYGTAQTHWGVTPRGQWALYNVKQDPGCENDLSSSYPEKVSAMAAGYDHWWDSTFPTLIARGGDEGDPNVSRNASRQAQKWKGPTTDRDSNTSKGADTKTSAATSSMFQRMDTDNNGAVDMDEYVGLFEPFFEKKDLDKNGTLDEAEFQSQAFKHADANDDQSLTKSEYQLFFKNQFRQRDANHDGQLEPSEM